MTHICDICGINFPLNTALLVHKLSIHKVLERKTKTSVLWNTSQTEDVLYSSDSECEYKLVFSIERLPKVKTENYSTFFPNEPETFGETRKYETNDGVSFPTPQISIDTKNKTDKCPLVKVKVDEEIDKQNENDSNSSSDASSSCSSSESDSIKQFDTREKSQKMNKREKTVQCHLCDKFFARRYTLGVHMRAKHNDDDHVIPKMKEAKKAYQCYICKKFYVRHSTLKFHLSTIHTSHKNELIFIQRTLLKQQRADSLPKPKKDKFLCKHCNTMFKRRSELEHHWFILRNGRPYFCKKCFTGFDAKADIIQHKRDNIECRDEPKLKKLLCTYCGKYFERKNSLNIHIRTHTNEKPFVCNICNRAFNVYATLRQHMNSHSGEKPYVCPVQGCEKTFSYLSGLRQHRYNVHEEPRFKCKICDKMFSKRGHME